MKKYSNKLQRVLSDSAQIFKRKKRRLRGTVRQLITPGDIEINAIKTTRKSHQTNHLRKRPRAPRIRPATERKIPFAGDSEVMRFRALRGASASENSNMEAGVFAVRASKVNCRAAAARGSGRGRRGRRPKGPARGGGRGCRGQRA